MNTNMRLFSPGPTPIAEASLKALMLPPLHHRSAAFTKVLKESLKLLKLLFDEEHIVAFPSTGSGALEASVVNFLSTGDTAICLEGGKFGERWSNILNAYKISHKVHSFQWGQVPDLSETAKLLKDCQPKALYTQACETSTATAYNIKKISELIALHSPHTLLVVDGVTAVGAYELSMKENAIDVLITGSQKALGLPVGLSFLGFSQKAYEVAKKSDLPKFYFNVLNELKSLSSGASVFSSPTQIWRALHAELTYLSEAGLSKKFDSCLNLQKIVHAWVDKNKETHRLSLFSQNPSPSLTAILLPDSMSASKVQTALIDKNYYIAKGQGSYSDKLLRIGHMANISELDMLEFLDVLSLVLSELDTSLDVDAPLKKDKES